MKVQIIATVYIVTDDDGNRRTYRRGQEADLPDKEAKLALDKGLVRKAGDDSELPPPNIGAAVTAPEQPDGTPLEEDSDGNPLTAGALTMADDDFKAPTSHAEADELAAKLGVTLPAKAKLADKADALRQVVEAQAAGEAPSTEDLNDLSEEELIQRAIDYGHSEEEVVELSQSELVVFVAEAMNRQATTPAGQAERTAELEQRREDSEEE